MINFYRRARKKMADDNRPIKYMRYAIGEIVLVVIGILIALQLNTLKEERKQIAKTNDYIDKIIDDIVKDTMNIDSLVSIKIRHYKNIDTYFEFFKKGNKSVDTFIDSCLNVKAGFNRYFPIDNTFKDMQSSGNISLLGKEQRIILSELSSQQEFVQIIIEKMVASTFTQIHESEKHIDRNPNDGNFYKILNVENNRENKIKGLLHLHNELQDLWGLAHIFIRYSSSIKQKSKESILLLQDQKNK